MNAEIRQLEPINIWNRFADLNAIPRASKEEKRVIAFMLGFGKQLQLPTFRDETGNVIIRKPASPGMEGRQMVTLQAHLDMVHQKNEEQPFDFSGMGISMYVQDGWVRAKGTTLGADNGIGVAAIMALLESTEIAHPPLEALFTVDEETGMSGALGLAPGLLEGELMLNLDTEEDDELDIGCAGGIDINADRTYLEADPARGSVAFRISIKGLQGGHSGIDIHLGRGNANKILSRLLFQGADRFGIGLAEARGGGLRNAIPREASAIFLLPEERQFEFTEAFAKWVVAIREELRQTEPGLRILLEEAPRPAKVMDSQVQAQILRSLYAAHNGVYAMSAAIPGLVETSNNLAIIHIREGKIHIGCLCRSSVESAKSDLAAALRATFELSGCEVSFSGEYPGWNPDPESGLLKLLQTRYRALFGTEARVVACHAGLECGILGQKYPQMEIISFGPTIRGAHSPDEKVQLSSVRKFWALLQDVLLHIPEKGTPKAC